MASSAAGRSPGVIRAEMAPRRASSSKGTVSGVASRSSIRWQFAHFATWDAAAASHVALAHEMIDIRTVHRAPLFVGGDDSLPSV